MKIYPRIFLLTVVPAVLFLTVSCTGEEEDPFADNSYLLSSKLELIRTKDYILTLIDLTEDQYPVVTDVEPDIVSGVVVYSIEYSTVFMGEQKRASGLVCIPSAPGTYPVLAFQNGTNTLHSEAPTADPGKILYQVIEYAAATGYVVVIADYLGFGASDDIAHPYLHKESTVQSLIDMLFALKEFDADVAGSISMNNEYYLMGYSQGGWATLALLEAMEKDYASEFTVKAACCGGGPYDLDGFMNHILELDQYPMPVFIGYLANAYSEYDLYENPLSDIFNEPYAASVPGFYDGRHPADQINSQLTVNIDELFNAGFISGYTTDQKYNGVRSALSTNSVEGWDSDVPLLFLHGTADDYVFPFLSEEMHTAMLDAGSDPASCLYITIDGMDHRESAVPAGLAGYNFFKTYR